MKQPTLDAFQVIGDPSRRKMLMLLSKGSMTINTLAENFEMSRPAVSKHIKLLHSAGFISITVIGRERYCILKKNGFEELQAWMTYFDKFWSSKLKNLETLLNIKITKLKSKKMNTTDFTTTLLVDQTPEEVFNAVNNPRNWWSEEIEGSTDKLNAEFDYHFEDIHRCRLKLIELLPNEKVVWLVLENYFKPGIFENTSELMSEWDDKRQNATQGFNDGAQSLPGSQLINEKAEWVNTKIVFEIIKKENKTLLRFTHLGLVPDYECFEVCVNGWTHYIRQSLFGLITTGEGQPNSTGTPMTTDEEKFHTEG